MHNSQNKDFDYVCIYLKNGIEIPYDQWVSELKIDYHNDYIDDPNEEYFEIDDVGFGNPYTSNSGNIYDAHIYDVCNNPSAIIDCMIEDGYLGAINDLLVAIKKIPDSILHEYLVGATLRWPACTRTIEYHDGKYWF